MGDMDDDIIIFHPLLALEAPPVDGIFIAFVKEVINTLKPRVWQISRLNELDLHRSSPLQ
jgi:hypothetical protein